MILTVQVVVVVSGGTHSAGGGGTHSAGGIGGLRNRRNEILAATRCAEVVVA